MQTRARDAYRWRAMQPARGLQRDAEYIMKERRVDGGSMLQRFHIYASRRYISTSPRGSPARINNGWTNII